MVVRSLKYIFLLILIVFQLQPLFAQPVKIFTSTSNRRALELYMQSDEYMIAKRYTEAIILLEKAIVQDPQYIDAYLRLSNIYYKTGNLLKEKDQYLKVIEINPNLPSVYFNYANLLMRELNYAEAIVKFNKFIELELNDQKFIDKAKKNIEISAFRDHAMKNPVPFNPENLGEGINTALDEYWPVLTADEQVLYFTRRLDQNPEAKIQYLRYNEDIFFGVNEKNSWPVSNPIPGNINTINTNEGAISISPDGKFLLFTIYSELKDGKWFPPKNIGYPINSRSMETQPSISFDGKTLYFSSNRAGSFGNLDIWKSTRQDDGSWGVPVNLGQGVNTPGKEQSPFIHPDDKTLYFSSDYRMGMGDADIYMAVKNDSGIFENAVNLGYPINTDQSEISIFISSLGNKAYFASRREGGIGGLDIYSFDLPEPLRPSPVCYLKGVVYDNDTKAKLEATFELIDLKTAKTVVISKSEVHTGKFLVAIPSDRNYALNVSKDGYLFYSAHLPLKGITSSAYHKDVYLIPVKVGEKLILNNIFFEFDKADLKPESKVELYKVIELMQKNPAMRVEIGGHTDNQGTDAYNLKLSDDRAKSVFTYLRDVGGIDPARMTFKGFGETQPLDTNDTESGRANNRRTEFKITAL